MAKRLMAAAGTTITFDHGAQYFDQSQDAAATSAAGKGAVDVRHLGDGTSHIVGVLGMVALPRALANCLYVTLNTCVKTVTACGDLTF